MEWKKEEGKEREGAGVVVLVGIDAPDINFCRLHDSCMKFLEYNNTRNNYDDDDDDDNDDNHVNTSKSNKKVPKFSYYTTV